MLAVVAGVVLAHVALGFVVGRLHARPEETRRTTHAKFESIAEEAMAIRVALEIDRMRIGYIDEVILGKYLRTIIRENLGMTLKAEGWEMIRVEQGMDAIMAPGESGGSPGWTGYADVRRERKPFTVTIRKSNATKGEVVKVEEGRR
jgi:hypothetical protein